MDRQKSNTNSVICVCACVCVWYSLNARQHLYYIEVKTQWFCDCAIHSVKDLLSVHTKSMYIIALNNNIIIIIYLVGRERIKYNFSSSAPNDLREIERESERAREYITTTCVVMNSFWIYPDNCTGALFWHNFHHIF